MRSRIAIIAAMLGIFGATGAAVAADWVPVTNDVNGSLISIDVASINKNGDLVTYWYLSDASKDKSVRFRSSKTQSRNNCSTKQSQDLFSAFYMPNNQVITETGNSFTWYPVIPDTVGEAIHDFVCSYGKE